MDTEKSITKAFVFRTLTESLPEAKLRVRMSSQDAHYAGNLVDGARILQLFGDLATELTIRYDGDEGLLRAYDSVEFLAPVYGGDFLEPNHINLLEFIFCDCECHVMTIPRSNA